MTNQIRLITGKIKALLIGCLVAFIILEIAFRFFNVFEMRVQGDSIILPKNQHYKISTSAIPGIDKNVIHTKNSLGFRGDNPPRDYKNDLTLVTVGGSTTECFYLSDPDTWPALLGTKLRRNFKKFWINNAGLDGHSSYGHTVLVRDVLCGVKPQFTLFLLGVNEINREDLSHWDKKGIQNKTTHGFLKHEILARSRVLSFLYFFWIKNRNIVQTDNVAINLAALPQKTVSEERRTELFREHEKYIKAYEGRLRNLIALSKQCSMRPILMTQPGVVGKGKDPATGVDLSKVEVYGMDGKTAWEILERYNDVTRKVAAEEKILLIDLAVKMPKNTKFFYDLVHYTKTGAQKVADIIYQELCPYLAEQKKEFQIAECGASS